MDDGGRLIASFHRIDGVLQQIDQHLFQLARIGLYPDLFILEAHLAVFIAAITISYKSWREASLNPADSLRYE